jgi:hypothetical protein
MPKYFLALLMSAAVVSCNSTPADLAKEGNGGRTLIIEENYEVVYSRIKQYTIRCFESSGSNIYSDIFAGSKTARVGLSISGMIGSVPFFDVKISFESDKKTRISVALGPIVASRVYGRIEDAARTGSESC